MIGKKKDAWVVGLLFVLLACITGCHARELSQGMLRDGEIHTQKLSVKVQGNQLPIPIFRDGRTFHTASAAGDSFSLVVRNHSAEALRLIALYSDGIVTKKTTLELLAGETKYLTRAQHFHKWRRNKSGLLMNMPLGHIKISYRSKKDQQRVGVVALRYGHCQAYLRRGVCPQTCVCSSFYKPQTLIVKTDLMTRTIMR